MEFRNQTAQVLVLFVGALIGGFLAGPLLRGNHAAAQNEPAHPEPVVTTSLTLLDGKGKKRISAGTVDSTVFLEFLDQSEKPVIRMSATDKEAILKFDTTRAADGGAEAVFGVADGMAMQRMTSYRHQSECLLIASAEGAMQGLVTRWGPAKELMESRTAQWADKNGGGFLATAPGVKGDPHFGGKVTLGYSQKLKHMALEVTNGQGQQVWQAP
ncbi:MAG: hypothetical protein BroJett014_29590 [Planctomycetota bacterium]|nr:hypothetical protein [Planctomycetota bacterium]GIK53986.1 MAG: hypothetical protein BroJett014_29590 [Planctomycetota bacterium]